MLYIFIVVSVVLLAVVGYLGKEVFNLKSKIADVSNHSQAAPPHNKNVKEEASIEETEPKKPEGLLIYPKPPIGIRGWFNSVYDLRYDWVDERATANLPMVNDPKDLGPVSLVVLCTFVDVKGDKIRLKLVDLFDTMWTEFFPAKAIPPAELSQLANRIVLINGINKDGKLYVKQIRRTIYTKIIS